jgi:two-component system, NtrC family, nitrogen regulation sensor histidine kinase NtrY
MPNITKEKRFGALLKPQSRVLALREWRGVSSCWPWARLGPERAAEEKSAEKGALGAKVMSKKTWGAMAGVAGAMLRRRPPVDDGSHPLTPQAVTPQAVKAKSRRMFWFGMVCSVVSILSGLATYLILTGLTPISPSEDVAPVVLLFNVIPVLAMAGVIAWHTIDLWRARRRQAAGSALHVRIVGLFVVIAVLPSIFLAIFASVALDRGLNQWFSLRTTAIVENSRKVALAHLSELVANVRNEAVGLAKEIEDSASLANEDRVGFARLFSAEATLRMLPQAYLIDRNGKVLFSAQADTTAYQAPPREAFKHADAGKMVSIEPQEYHRGAHLSFTGAAAMKKLQNFDDTYIYVLRPVRQAVIRQLIATMLFSTDYDTLKENRKQVQMANGIMYVAIAFTLSLGAIWLGMWFTNQLLSPIQRLIAAAQEISQGNLDVQVEVDRKQGDLAQLGSSFNKMTSDLRSQRDELVQTNGALDERRRFIEAVLSGVTAGVIGVDVNGVITLANRSALEMLEVRESRFIGARLEEAAPEFRELLDKAGRQGRKLTQGQLKLVRAGSERSFAVRITREGEGRQDYGLVVTFDDISELVVAQRTSAWADVARRLAHEIKNPLTPIQLSAERIRRKYGSAITRDREIFDRCTDTIIRHVGDIGRMVDEFSSFARMPKPDFAEHNLAEAVREAVILFQMSHPEIKYVIDVPKEPMMALCDRRLITQAITNLVKNAGEAIAGAEQGGTRGPGYKGRITARLRAPEGRLTIEVQDNGVGLPKENRYRLVEPYVTTRQKGTGLGLAIVQRITEQHGGQLELEDAPGANGAANGKSGDGAETAAETGALVRLTLPANRAPEGAAQGARMNVGVGPEAALSVR